VHAAAEHDQAAQRRADHEQRDQAKRLGRRQPLPCREADAHPGRVGAHEGNEQTAEMQKADAVNIAGQSAQRAAQKNIAA
jgi:hypothetical protein